MQYTECLTYAGWNCVTDSKDSVLFMSANMNHALPSQDGQEDVIHNFKKFFVQPSDASSYVLKLIIIHLFSNSSKTRSLPESTERGLLEDIQ